jgi:signal transduction histidine kinase/ActR/RegA family two-component response regulator
MITVEDIRQFTIFRDMPTEALAVITPRLISKTFPANTTIIRRGDTGQSMFMILSGRAAATSTSDEGVEYTLSTMTEGDIFGEIALLTGEPRTANVKAITDVRAIELSQDIFNELRQRYPELNSAFFRLLAQRISNKDIRQQIEEKLKESEQRLYRVIQGSPIPTFVIGKDHRVIYWNRALEELSGIKAEEIIGKKEQWRAFYSAERPCLADLLVDQALEAIPQWYLDKYTKSRLLDEAYEATDFFPELGENGKWLRFTASVIRDSQGNVVGAIETLEDVTEHVRAEEELIRVKKLESLGIFAGGIAHDFNNLLSALLRNVFAAKLSLTDEQEEILGEELEMAEKLGLQAKELAHRLITFSTGGEPMRKVGSLSQLLIDTIELSLSGSNVRCEFVIPDDLWAIEMDNVQIRQVIHNLVINAREAMPEGGVISIHAENMTVKSGNSVPLKEGKYVKWYVKDHGVGIPKSYLEKMFDPYVTTKPPGRARGMGLGLAICRSIIKKHDGFIAVESEPGMGSTFFVYLPADPHKGISKMEDTDGAVTRKGKVLVMDDEETVRNATGIVLNYLGYDVEYAKDGSEAVDLYRRAKEKKQPFTAVILDLTVSGGMGGKEAIKELLAIDPSVKAVITCGYSDDPIVSEYKKHGFCQAIDVPYDIEKMKDILSNMSI